MFAVIIGSSSLDDLVQVASNVASGDADTIVAKPSSKKQTKTTKNKIVNF